MNPEIAFATASPVLFTLKVYGIVIIVSLLCSVIIWGIVRILSSLDKPVAVPAKAMSKPASASAPKVEGVPVEHVAVIAAAAYAIFGTAAIVRIENTGRGAAWVSSGRLAHQTSHAPSYNR